MSPTQRKADAPVPAADAGESAEEPAAV